MTTRPTCATCRHWHRSSEDEGECRFHAVPPTLQAFSDHNRRVRWGLTLAWEGCGQHRACPVAQSPATADDVLREVAAALGMDLHAGGGEGLTLAAVVERVRVLVRAARRVEVEAAGEEAGGGDDGDAHAHANGRSAGAGVEVVVGVGVR